MALIDELIHGLRNSRAISIEGLLDVTSILVTSRSNYRIGLGRLAVTDVFEELVFNPDGSKLMLDELKIAASQITHPGNLPEKIPVKVGGQHAVVRINEDGTMTPFGVVGSQYTVVQNESIVLDALAVVDSSENIAQLAYAGNGLGGRVFFVGVHFPPFSVSIAAHEEVFNRSMLIYSGHDGNWAHHCSFRFEEPGSGSVLDFVSIKSKHFSNVNERTSVAAANYRKMKALSDALLSDVQLMAQVQLPPKSPVTVELIGECAKASLTQNKLTDKNIEDLSLRIMDCYLSERHSGKRGFNGWALYTAFAEVDDENRARVEKDEGGLIMMRSKNFGSIRKKLRQSIISAHL